jgi:hypothetical protein
MRWWRGARRLIGGGHAISMGFEMWNRRMHRVRIAEAKCCWELIRLAICRRLTANWASADLSKLMWQGYFGDKGCQVECPCQEKKCARGDEQLECRRVGDCGA